MSSRALFLFAVLVAALMVVSSADVEKNTAANLGSNNIYVAIAKDHSFIKSFLTAIYYIEGRESIFTMINLKYC